MLRLLLCAALFAGLSAPAQAALMLYGSYGGPARSGVNGGAIVRIDPNTGLATVLGTPIPGVGITGLAVDSAGRLIGSTSEGAGPPQLIEINPLTGALVSVLGNLTFNGVSQPVTDLAYNPVTQFLYGMSNVSNGRLVRIDMNTGAFQVMGTIPSTGGGFGSIGFSQSGTLYELATNGDQRLTTINPNNGQLLTNIPTTGQTVGALGLTVRRTDGLIFFSDGTDPFGRSLYTLNPTTGAAQLVGSFGQFGSLHDLAFLDIGGTRGPDGSLPEPASLGLLAIGGALTYAGAWRRRRRQAT